MYFNYIVDTVGLTTFDVAVMVYNLLLTMVYATIGYVGYKQILRIFNKGRWK